jgi:FkbM family methyltransferase
MIKSLLKDNKLFQKVKIIKELVLGKLDAIIVALSELGAIALSIQENQRRSQQKFQEIQETINHLLVNSQSTLENQVFLLKSSIETVQAVHKSVETVQAVHQSVNKSESALGELRQSINKSESALGELRQSTGYIGDESQRIHQSIQQIYMSVGESYRSVEKSYQEFSNIRREIVEVRQENQTQNTLSKQFLEQIAADVHDQKFKVVTDPSYFQAIDIELMVYLYSFLPHRRAIDVGANRGDVSGRLLQTGYEVYAFEPFPPVLTKLKERLADNPNFHAFPYALGATCETMDLHIAADQTAENTYEDATFYNSLTPHSLSEGLTFTETIPVEVKTLASLHNDVDLPPDIGLVKIDTEGFDLEVIKGMADHRYPVVVAEFWDPSFPFGQTGAMNHLKDLVPAMRERGYGWHIIIYRIWGSHDISFYCNANYSLANSWGNVFFFQDHAIFSEALKWCNATMPATYFST